MKSDTVNKKFKFKRLSFFNKYIIMFLFIYFLLGVGVTYAYLSFQVEENTIITGNVVAIDAEVDVELVVGSYEEMVPLDGEALSNALNGVGSTNGACVDNAGNLSCQVYKITLTNKGSRLKHIDGTIELYAKDGSGNVYNNLMWREITDPITIKEDAIFHTMPKSKLVSDMTIESKEVRVWYIAVWLNEIEQDQLETDKGDFGGTVTFESFEVQDNAYVEAVMEPNAQSDENIDFTQTSDASGTNGIYLRSGTENDTYPIYYYRGNVDNNLIFADTCWKVVRTTGTGGLKLIYNGVPTDGTCDNTGESSQIGTNSFNEGINFYGISQSVNNSLSGYMSSYVGTNFLFGYYYKFVSKDITAIKFGNDVTYSNGKYTLVDTISSSDWASLYNGDLNNYHYTCFDVGDVCESLFYIAISSKYSDNEYSFGAISLSNGLTIEDVISFGMGADDSKVVYYNDISSYIKGDKDTEGTLDYWYYTNIEQEGYSDYIEDAVWCNDRSTYSLGRFNPDGGIVKEDVVDDLTFWGYKRLEQSSPNLTCSRNVDSFTVDELNGNGNLDYSIGLLTSDEIMLAGGVLGSTTNTYYLNSGSDYWVNTPGSISHPIDYPSIISVNSLGNLGLVSSYDYLGVRPSISLKPGFTLAEGGDGSVSNPYVVE